MDFEEINPNIWTPQHPGDSIEGVYIQKRDGVGQNQSRAYYLEKDGRQVMIWDTTILNDKMTFVKVGEYVRITFVELKQNAKKQPLKVFKVERQKQRDGLMQGMADAVKNLGVDFKN